MMAVVNWHVFCMLLSLHNLKLRHFKIEGKYFLPPGCIGFILKFKIKNRPLGEEVLLQNLRIQLVALATTYGSGTSRVPFLHEGRIGWRRCTQTTALDYFIYVYVVLAARFCFHRFDLQKICSHPHILSPCTCFLTVLTWIRVSKSASKRKGCLRRCVSYVLGMYFCKGLTHLTIAGSQSAMWESKRNFDEGKKY